jgi:hypothetical protein
MESRFRNLHFFGYQQGCNQARLMSGLPAVFRRSRRKFNTGDSDFDQLLKCFQTNTRNFVCRPEPVYFIGRLSQALCLQ